MITEMKLAEFLYAANPTRYPAGLGLNQPGSVLDTVLSWEDALSQRTTEALYALGEASRLMRFLTENVTVTDDNLADVKKISASLKFLGLMGPSRGGMSKDAADLMMEGTKAIDGLLLSTTDFPETLMTQEANAQQEGKIPMTDTHDDVFLTPGNDGHPAGTRLLVRHPHSSEVLEIRVIEWAPSGRFVKIRKMGDDVDTWIKNPQEDGPIVIELLED